VVQPLAGTDPLFLRWTCATRCQEYAGSLPDCPLRGVCAECEGEAATDVRVAPPQQARQIERQGGECIVAPPYTPRKHIVKDMDKPGGK
jgi:hypothetical protein